LTGRCLAITQEGQPCRGLVRVGNDYCPAHDPARQEARRRAASKAGKSGPGRELTEVKRNIRAVVDGVRDGSIESRVGAVVFQGYNTLLKTLDVERRWYETDQLEGRLEELEAALERSKEGSGYGYTG
jgi:hypothetical protein